MDILGRVSQRLYRGLCLSEHTATAGMGILDIVNRVLIGLRDRQVNIKNKLGIGLTRDKKKPYGIPALLKLLWAWLSGVCLTQAL